MIKMEYCNKYYLILSSYHFLKKHTILIIILPPVEEFIFFVSSATVLALVRLPFRQTTYANVVIFKNKDAFHYATSLIALNFAFTGAVMTMSLRDKNPKMACYCRRLAVLSILVAAGVLAPSAVLVHG